MSKNERQNVTALRPELMPVERPLKALGLMGWKIHAGPFRQAPLYGFMNLCLQAEKPSSPHYHKRLPIPDFGLPDTREAVFALAWVIWQGVARKRNVFIGCMGGVGRTGTMLSILTRVAFNVNGKAAVEHVRHNYCQSACETRRQENFVADFPVRNLRRWLKICKVIAKLS